MSEMRERMARAMMRTTDIPEHNDVETCSLDWCGNELWSCDFEAMAGAALTASDIRKTIRNCIGAFESNQVIDKDVEGVLRALLRDVDAAIEGSDDANS